MTKMILKSHFTDLNIIKNEEGSSKEAGEVFGELSVFESREKCRVSYK